MTRAGRWRRGFTLTEVVVVLVLMGALMALFVANRGSTSQHADTIAAQGATSQAADAVVSAYIEARNAAAPACDDVSDTSSNTHAFSSPCALVDAGPGPRYLPAATASLDSSSVSVAEQPSGDGWQVVLVSAPTADNAGARGACQVLVHPVPGGSESYYQYPQGPNGCSASDALQALDDGSGDCPASEATSWRTACALPTRP